MGTHFFTRRFTVKLDRFKLSSAVAVFSLLACLASGNPAQADVLQLGGSFNSFAWTLNTGSYNESGGGSGSIDPSYLNSAPLPWVYCISIPDNINAPDTYNNTTVRNDGKAVFGANNPWVGTPGLTLVGGSATIAGQVAWIVTNYADAAIGDVAKEEAVQAAIWKAIYGSAFTVQTSSVDTASNAIITALGSNTADLASVRWLTPGKTGDNTIRQAVVTAVPEPSTLAIAGLASVGLLAYSRKRRSNV
jgi:hypothetical protein